MNRFLVFCLAFTVCNSFLIAQADTIPGTQYPAIEENRIIGTKWKYTHTFHEPNKLIVHKANQSYEYFLHLKYDFTSETYLNGSRINGKWGLNDQKNQLYYPFRNNHWWNIVELTGEKMILEFTLNNVVFQYHYVQVDTDSAPFIPKPDELPEVEVEETISTSTIASNMTKANTRRLLKKEKKQARKQKRKEKKDAKFKMAPQPADIEVALIGGGFYGGVDPIIKNYIQIKPTGRLIKEFESLNSGLIKTKKNLDRNQMERLIAFVESKDFFALDNYYDCNSKECHFRKTKAPLPIPLRLSIRYGDKRKVITISIWGVDKNAMKYVTYPEALDLIIDNIAKLAEM